MCGFSPPSDLTSGETKVARTGQARSQEGGCEDSLHSVQQPGKLLSMDHFPSLGHCGGA